MAEAFMRKYAPHIKVASAGTIPRNKVHPVVADVMSEIGINIGDKVPQKITQAMLDDATVVNMGCIDQSACPAMFTKTVKDWMIPDPKGKTLEEVREIRDQIKLNVQEMIKEIG